MNVSKAEVKKRLNKAIKEAGGVGKFANKVGVAQQNLVPSKWPPPVKAAEYVGIKVKRKKTTTFIYEVIDEG